MSILNRLQKINLEENIIMENEIKRGDLIAFNSDGTDYFAVYYDQFIGNNTLIILPNGRTTMAFNKQDLRLATPDELDTYKKLNGIK